MGRCDLTARQLDVLQGIVMGLSNKQIAYALGLQHQTVRNHVGRIYDKLLPDRAGGERSKKYRVLAVREAMRRGSLRSEMAQPG